MCEIVLENIHSFILNIPSDHKFAGIIPMGFNRKHWIAIRRISNLYYNLDSKLKSPKALGADEDLLKHLTEQLKEKDSELLIIVSPNVHESASWKRVTLPH